MEDLFEFNTLTSSVTGWTGDLMSTAATWRDAAAATGGQWWETAQPVAQAGIATFMGIDLPVPDAALIVAFGLVAYALLQSARQSRERLRTEIETLYQSELLTANRRVHQAKGELRRAELEIERERQKRRRETGRAMSHRRRATPKLVKPVAQTA